MTQPAQFWFDEVSLDELTFGAEEVNRQLAYSIELESSAGGDQFRPTGSLIRFVHNPNRQPLAFRTWWQWEGQRYSDRSLGQLDVQGLLGDDGLWFVGDDGLVTADEYLDELEKHWELITQVEAILVDALKNFDVDCKAAIFYRSSGGDRSSSLDDLPFGSSSGQERKS